MEGARRIKAGMEGTGRPMARTERAQCLQSGPEEVGRLNAVTERNRLIQVGTEGRKFGCSKARTKGALRLLVGKDASD